MRSVFRIQAYCLHTTSNCFGKSLSKYNSYRQAQVPTKDAVEKFVRTDFSSGYDLAMLASFNSKERDAEEWRALFEQADSRLKLERIVGSPGSILSVIEAKWCP